MYKIFLLLIKKRILNNDENTVNSLIIILWKMAYNLQNYNIKHYLLSDFENLLDEELAELTISLGMKSKNIEYAITIINFLNKLDN